MKRPLLFTLLLAGIAGIGFKAFLLEQPPEDLVVPEGFAVEEVYPSDRLGSVVAINFDSQGRLVIGQQQNTPVKALLDNNGDGVFDEERIMSDQVTDAQGILFDGFDALVVAEGPQGAGLYRLVDNDGDSRAERVELVERAWGGIGQHGPHAIFWGPDGYLYWDQGNASGIHEAYHPLSPLRAYQEGTLNGRCDPRGHACDWRAPGGIFIRTDLDSRAVTGEPVETPENTEWELFAGGFRNQYDGAFNLMGELFTYDSDMEWDLNLPHYKGTSSVHVVAGGDHAWRSGSMNHPWEYLDNLPPMQNMGRGSPTGVTVMQTYNYPAEYWDMVLQSDWSRGRVIGGRLTKNGATYTQQASNFIYGEPLNVTDLEVGPDGNLYVSLGGGGGPGALYRIVYNGPNAMQRPAANTPLDRVLTMHQPRTAYSRKITFDTKQEMGEAAWQQGLTAEVRNTAAIPERRRRAMELLQVFGPGMDDNVLRPLANDPSWEVRAAAAYYLGMKTSNGARQTLVAMAKDSDPFVQRRALEGLLRTGIHPAMNPSYDPVEDILPLLSSPDRFVRYQARAVLKQTRRALWEQAAMEVTGYPQAPEALMAVVETMQQHSPRITDVTRLLTREVQLLQGNPSEAQLLSLVRVIQRTALEDYGVVEHEMESALPPQPPSQDDDDDEEASGAYQVIGETLLARFPAQDTTLSREIARTLAYLETPGAVEEISMELGNVRNNRAQQIFYAEQLSYMDEGWDDASIDRTASWLEKVYEEQWRGGASFGGYINYTREALMEVVPPEDHAALAQRLQSALEASQPQVALAVLQGEEISTPLADQELFEDLVYRPNVLSGDPAAGAAAFEKAACIACHSFGSIGTPFGPDLTTVGQRFSRRDLVRSVIFPHEDVSDIYPAEEVTRTNGEVLVGLTRDAGDNLVVAIMGGTEITIPKADIRTRVRSDKSVMPEGLLNLLDNNERRALMNLLLAGPEAIPDSALNRINNR
jgi:putative heme-binding domain-containing protein